MKTFKKLTSLLLAVVMIVTTLSVGMTSLASIVTRKTSVTVSIVVPEAIYLTPGSNTFQYYIAGAAPGNTPSPTAGTTGAISFTASAQASSISLSYTGASSITLSNTSASNASTLTTSITAGAMAAAGQSGVITWTFTYVIGGQTFHSYAYTYVYSPFMNQAGAQGGYKYATSIGNEPVTVAYAFLTGIHGTYGGAYRSLFVGTSGKTMNPILPGWGNSNVPSGDADGYFNDYKTYFTADANGGVTAAGGRTRNGDKKITYGSGTGGGYLVIDTSRYADASFSVFPNFKAGWMIQFSKESSERHSMESFKTTDSAISFAKDINYENGTTGQAFYGYAPTGTVPSEDTTYTVNADIGFERSNSSHVHLNLQFALDIRLVDKSTLRTKLSTAIANNLQDYEYDEFTYGLYQRYLSNAATVLGNPDVTAGDITTAINQLNQAIELLQTADYTATVNHKLPAADGFTYTYNGVEYTAENGYVTIPETKGFEGGSDVEVSKETFNGYTYVADEAHPATQTFTKRGSDLTVDYVYTPVTSVINFNYGAGLDDYVTDNQTKSITVTYGQPYGTFPTPKMDGWRFVRWVNGAGAAVTGETLCTMVSSSLDLTASWNCNFGGGHGTEDDPFLISSAAYLDKIDDTTAYSVIRDGSCTAGKYYKQTANITYDLSKVAVSTFNGNYDGQNYAFNIPSALTVADAAYGCIFGTVSGAVVKDINVAMNGTLRATGSASTYAGFFGDVADSAISGIQITFGGTVSGSTSGILAGKIANTTVSDSAVTLNGGTISGDAFIGSKSGTLQNTWVLVNTAPTGFATSSANNIMRIRENGTVTMTYTNGQYAFTASPNTGWSVQYRDANDSIITSGAVYSPSVSATGEQDYVCFVQTVTFNAGTNGTLTGAGSYVLRQGETVTGLVPNPANGYAFNGWTNPTNGTFSDTAPYTFTMGSTAGTITANFGLNSYTLAYDANAGGTPITVVAPKTHACIDRVVIAPAIERTGYTFKEWNTAADGSGTPYTAGQEYDALSTVNGTTVTLYARWNINSYVVSFNTNCELQLADELVEYGKPLTFPNLVRTGYKRLEWCTDAGLSGAGNLPGTTKNITGRTTFYAKWTPISYTFTFSAPGATNIPANVTRDYDSGAWTMPATAVPAKTGYNFNGWDTAVGGNGTRYYPLDPVPGNQTTVDGTIITLHAQWTEATYEITWDLQGGTIDGSTVNPTSTATFSKTYTLPTGAMTKSGFSFKGWYTEPTGGTQITDTTTVSVTADTSFYARWGTASYIVAFDANGGSGTMDSISASVSTPFTLPQNAMTRPGYDFMNWNIVPDGSSTTYYADGATVSNDLTNIDGATVTLYAQWKPVTFSITYNARGGNGTPGGQSVIMDGAAVNLRAPTKTTATIGDSNYTFLGWAYTDAKAAAMEINYAGKVPFAVTAAVLADCDVDWTVAKPVITLYAVWGRDTTVTWNLQGGNIGGNTTNPTTTVAYGRNYALPTQPARDHFTFDGWFTESENNKGVEITNDSVLQTNEDTMVYAHWTQISSLDSTYVTEYYLQNADGTYPQAATYTSTSSAEIGSMVNAVQNTYIGYTIDIANELNVLSDTVTDAATGNMLTLKVYYTINSYDVTFNANGGEGAMQPQSFKYMTADDLNACTFTRTGYSFAGWSRTSTGNVAFSDGGSFTMGNASVELFAVWTPNTYTIEFRGSGATSGAMSPMRCTYDSTYALTENAFAKTGCAFVGWAATEGGAVAYEDKAEVTNLSAEANGSIVLYAVWSNVDYTISFDANGATDGTAPQAFTANYNESIELPGSDIVIESDGNKESRTFIGWKDTAGTLYAAGASYVCPASNMTFTAVWSANYYELNALTALVKGYEDAQQLPASADNDPAYVAGGEIAETYGFDGMYDWSYFETTALENAYQAANLATNHNLPQSAQNTVDGLVSDLAGALNGLTLAPVDYDYRFMCYDSGMGYFDGMTGMFYPPCEDDGMHSFNSIKALIDQIIADNIKTGYYEASSLGELRLYVYGNGTDIQGIIKEVETANLKLPVQEMLGEYVQRMEYLYHTVPVLKDADYSRVDALITDYLPGLNGVTYSDLMSYYEADSVYALTSYYEYLDRTFKIVSQDSIDQIIYYELKYYIDALVPLKADYFSMFNLILSIPKGTAGFSYPLSQVSRSNYDEWMQWAQTNAGALSALLDNEYLSTRYTESSVATLGRVLDGLDWTLNIFSQNIINGATNMASYAAVLGSAINGLTRKTYTVTFYMNDGTENVFETDSDNYYGDAVSLPATNPSREGYTFLYWGVDAEGTAERTTKDKVLTNMEAYAIWEEVIETSVSLIAKENSTTVIDDENGFIYGLCFSPDEATLNAVFLNVLGNGHLEYEYDSFIGTGTVVKLVNDSTGNTDATYQIVIMGDLNGDGLANSTDIGIIKSVIARTTKLEEGSAVAFAADLFLDGTVNSSDLTYEKSLYAKTMQYDQANRQPIQSK